MDSVPWITLGDFNVVRFRSEKLLGDQSWPNYKEEFNDCCRAASLDDLRFSGQLTTWSKGSGEGFKARKLDRALVNYQWHSSFPEAEAIFQEPGASDHSPVLVSLGMQKPVRRPPFRFFSYWAEHPNFEAIVSEAWQTSLDGSFSSAWLES